MTTEVVTVMEADNLATIAADFEVYRFRHLPVVDGDVLVGVVSERDLFRASVSQLDHSSVAQAHERRILEDTFVRSIMNDAPETIGPDATLADAAARIVRTRVGCLPVVDEQRRLLGIVTEHDLLRQLARAHL